jgi:RimJ/RimL family protein N-acetyltransferase
MRIEDAEGMFELNMAEDVYRNTGDKPFRDLEEAKDLIRNYDQYKKFKMGRFSLIEISTGEYVGWCGLKYLEDTKEVDLGYRIIPGFRGKGYASEAAERCLEYGFNELDLENIKGRATEDNLISINILKKLGMTFEKKFKDHDSACVQYHITKKGWMDLHSVKEIQAKDPIK